MADALPTLTLARQEEVYQSMRLAAQPNVDFFVLITLSAIIATLGLLQGSGAVIIGAMLVAPLMSPILAIAMSMVHGNLRLLVVAAEATTKGAVLAIMVGVGVVLISPIDTATLEILSRTQPNILDLMVALASGAAAGYAISRKEVAAALPGVAIAAALVPPLCVVGYGIGTSQLDMAGGALLLFITNLVAIIFAAAGTFLALGFHPARAETGELVRGLKVTLISLGIILVILVSTTVVTVVNSNRKEMVEQIFTSEMVSRAADVRELSIERTKDGFIITATIIDIEGNQLSDKELSKVEQELSDALDGEPVIINATIIPGVRSELNKNFATIRQIQDLFKTEMAQYNAQAITVEVKQTDNGYNVDTSVITLGDKPITQSDMANIQQSMTDSLRAPISIRTTIIPGNQINVIAPTPMPSP